jgi:hypothetical protein
MVTQQSDPRPKRRLVTRLALALAVFALTIPATALAAGNDPTAAQYAPTNQQIAAGGGGGSTPTGGGNIAGLPLTGLDLGVLLIAATVLVGTGVALRKLSEPAKRSPSS